VLRDVPLSHIYPYLNLQMLYGKHLGVRGLVERLLAAGDPKALEVHEIIETLKRDAVGRGLLEAQGVYRWYRARAAGDAVILFDPSGRETARFDFPRQRDGERLCLADYVRDDADDYVALFAVTCGAGVRELASDWKERGEYVRSHALQALAIECAEAFAEMLHSRMRTLWTLKRDAVGRGLLGAQGVYRWYRTRAAADAVILFDPSGRETARFDFPRQREGERLCLADYVRDDADDYVALFAVTCGAGVRELASDWKERGEYVRSHALQALAIECAEAFAEMLHSRMRTLWGFPDPPELAIGEKLKAHYRGIRVSFGYPACPNLADQATLFRLLEPETFGLTLTEGFMMDPEASVSGLVFHHPAAKYFKAD